MRPPALGRRIAGRARPDWVARPTRFRGIEVRLRTIPNRPIRPGLVLTILAAIGPGCGTQDAGPDLGAESSSVPGDPETVTAIQGGLNEIINQADSRYKSLKYEYSEGLLAIID